MVQKISDLMVLSSQFHDLMVQFTLIVSCPRNGPLISNLYRDLLSVRLNVKKICFLDLILQKSENSDSNLEIQILNAQNPEFSVSGI